MATLPPNLKESHKILFKRDATFCIRPALQPGVGDPWLSLESYNVSGYYIRHADFHLFVSRDGGSFQADATFRFVDPL
ncbi:AbfB domain-containing protein [Sorangium sp. So ce362]|uniref:AbfB domain-containing protein n=1 Tax=Sorangium sp. So ce362 TaxID=3133303 RepID=UPI003F63723D